MNSILSRTWRASIAVAACLLAGGDVPPVASQTEADELSRARREIAAGRYESAASVLESLSERARGEVLQESLFLLGSLARSTQDAQNAYQRVIDEDPRGDWARRSYLELAKVQYALGHYGECWRLLEDSDACDSSQEACLFHGLSGIMLERFEAARRPLERIRRGKLRTWAYLSLAEADMKLGRQEDACRRYEALASAMISPTALYRHAECLEQTGDAEGALHEFGELIDNFRDTPEAVLAAEKVLRMAEPPPPPAHVPVTESADTARPPEGGFTIQFGSFRDRGNAIKLAAKIKRVFPGVRIDSELIRYREYHRVRFGYFHTREEAQRRGEEIASELGEDFTIMSLR